MRSNRHHDCGLSVSLSSRVRSFFEQTIIVYGMTMFGNFPIPSAITARIRRDAEKFSGCFNSQVTIQFLHDGDSNARNGNAHLTPKSPNLTNFEVSVQSTALCSILITPRAFGGWHCFGVFGKAVVFVFYCEARSLSGGRRVCGGRQRFVRRVVPRRTTRHTNL